MSVPSSGAPALASRLRKELAGWILIATGLTVLGLGAVLGAQAGQVREISPATAQEWRQYAKEVQQGSRSPSVATTWMLTETAIAQHDHARSAVDLLRFLGGGVALLGLILAVDLVRFRARHTGKGDSPVI
ncbi:MAG TPA: hypothetical protein VM365_07845 [Gemmatimonadales bacterium]|nr:hypothetical protein [Gemmatimonadales bacterium]